MPFSSRQKFADLLAFVGDVCLFACSIVHLLLTRVVPVCALLLLQMGKSLLSFAYSAVSSPSSSKRRPQAQASHSVHQIDEDEEDGFENSSWMDAPLSFFEDDQSHLQSKELDPIDDSLYFECYSSNQFEEEPYFHQRQALPSFQPVQVSSRIQASHSTEHPPYPAITRDSVPYPSISPESADIPHPSSHGQDPHQFSPYHLLPPYPLDSLRYPDISEKREAALYSSSPQVPYRCPEISEERQAALYLPTCQHLYRSSPTGPQQDGLHTLPSAEQVWSGHVSSAASSPAADVGIHDVHSDDAHDENARTVPPTFSDVESFVKEHAIRKLPPSFSQVERTLKELSSTTDEKHR